MTRRIITNPRTKGYDRWGMPYPWMIAGLDPAPSAPRRGRIIVNRRTKGYDRWGVPYPWTIADHARRFANDHPVLAAGRRAGEWLGRIAAAANRADVSAWPTPRLLAAYRTMRFLPARSLSPYAREVSLDDVVSELARRGVVVSDGGPDADRSPS